MGSLRSRFGLSRLLLLCALALSGCPFSPDGEADPSSGEGGSGSAGNGDGDGEGDTGPAGRGATGGGGAGTSGSVGGERDGGVAGTGGGASGGTGGSGGAPSPGDEPPTAIAGCAAGDPMDALQVVDARVDGHTLLLTVEHGGGCAEHAYGLCQDEDWTGSDPARVALTVQHDAMGDTCAALLTEELSFDLRVLGAQFENRFGERAGTIELLIGELTVEYGFDLDGDPPDEDFADLDARLEAANHCESLDECMPVHVAPCGTRYVSASEDVEELQSLLDDWAQSHGSDQLSCIALCHCGVLSCTQGKCTTAEDTDCTVAESDSERMVCL